jgi:hypothetical protein
MKQRRRLLTMGATIHGPSTSALVPWHHAKVPHPTGVPLGFVAASHGNPGETGAEKEDVEDPAPQALRRRADDE